jgi:hypothetical protein
MAREDEYMEPEDEGGADGLGTGLVVITSLCLIAALILVLMALKEYGRGMLA